MADTLDLAKRRIIELLTAQPEGLSHEQLCERITAGSVTIRRARDELENEGACLEYDRLSKRWSLTEPFQYSPLIAPRTDDLIALMVGWALLEPLVDDDIRERLRMVIEDLDDRLHAQHPETARLPKTETVSRAVTMATTVDADILRALLTSMRGGVVRISYLGPWSGNLGRYTVEPWGLRLVDAAVYVRGFSREHAEPRTFNVASIQTCVTVDEPLQARIPILREVWNDGDPAFGVDHHEPGIAVVRLRGPVARWAETFRWHGSEVVERLGHDLYQRTVPYRSRREFARKLLTVLDALVSVEPPELAAELTRYVDTWRDRSLD